MKTLIITVGVIVAVLLFVVSPLISIYNRLQVQNVVVDNAWAAVETQYQRRFDLIPNLVGATKGYLKQEQQVFGAIAEARTRYASSRQSGSPEEQVEAYGNYESVIGRLLIVMENYPELKSDKTVQALVDELAGTENRITVQRDRYNEQVALFNRDIVRFPTNLIAGFMGLKARSYFKSTEAASTAPTVDLTI